MSETTATDLDLLRRLATRFKALGDATRLQILHALEPGESCVSDLVQLVGCSQANVSKHLGVLRSAGLVHARRDGMNVYYGIDDSAVLEVCRLMCGTFGRQLERDLACLGRANGAFSEPANQT